MSSNRSFSLGRLVLRTLAYYRGQSLLLALAVALCSMVISGALITGDSIRESLRQISSQSVGRVKSSVSAVDQWFSGKNADSVTADTAFNAAAIISVSGFVEAPKSEKSGAINLNGISSGFFSLMAKEAGNNDLPGPEEIYLNQAAARHLQAGVGDELILRVMPLSGMPGDAPYSLARSDVNTHRLKVTRILAVAEGGNFDLRVSQRIPLNGFLDREFLAKILDRPGKANLVVSDCPEGFVDLFQKRLQLEDYGLALSPVTGGYDLHHSGVFISDALEQAIDAAQIANTKVFGYFVNSFSANGKEVPYSFIAGLEEAPLPEQMPENAMVINSWLAQQLNVGPGDKVSVKAYVPGSYGSLNETVHSFAVHSVVPIEGAAADNVFMPKFPGMEGAESCSEWDPDLPVDLKKVRAEDEDYWYEYSGLPKAYFKLNTARRLWNNRFGSLTLIRFKSSNEAEISAKILSELNKARYGLIEAHPNAQKQFGRDNSVDFSGLFLGLGFFIILAAMLLLNMLFNMHLETRWRELSIMQLCGFSRWHLFKTLLMEGMAIASLGSLAGLFAGAVYAAVMIFMLQNDWQGAVNMHALSVHFTVKSFAIGFFAALMVASVTLWLTLRSFLGSDKAKAISSESELTLKPAVALSLPVISFAGAIILTVAGSNVSGAAGTIIFFFSGLLVLIASTQIAARAIISKADSSADLSIKSLAQRNVLRKFSRSKAVLRVIACSLFMILAVSANQKSPPADVHEKTSPTGGFSHWIETAIPVAGDLNEKETRYHLKLDGLPDNCSFAQFPILEGDDASCHNLNRAFRPTVVGIPQGAFAGRFNVESSVLPVKDIDELLSHELEGNLIAAVADADVIRWNLGKAPGDIIESYTSRGAPVRLKLVAGITGSVFQGKIMIAENHFRRLWPEISGSRLMLLQTASGQEDPAGRVLASALSRFGAHIERTDQRLDSFNAVQNTYLAIFELLGGLGLILACVGLTVLMRRNIIERRDELRFMRVLGFTTAQLKLMLFYEHLQLFVAGILCGILAAGFALIPLFSEKDAVSQIAGLMPVTVILILSGLLAMFSGLRFHEK